MIYTGTLVIYDNAVCLDTGEYIIPMFSLLAANVDAYNSVFLTVYSQDDCDNKVELYGDVLSQVSLTSGFIVGDYEEYIFYKIYLKHL